MTDIIQLMQGSSIIYARHVNVYDSVDHQRGTHNDAGPATVGPVDKALQHALQQATANKQSNNS